MFPPSSQRTVEDSLGPLSPQALCGLQYISCECNRWEMVWWRTFTISSRHFSQRLENRTGWLGSCSSFWPFLGILSTLKTGSGHSMTLVLPDELFVRGPDVLSMRCECCAFWLCDVMSELCSHVLCDTMPYIDLINYHMRHYLRSSTVKTSMSPQAGTAAGRSCQ